MSDIAEHLLADNRRMSKDIIQLRNDLARVQAELERLNAFGEAQTREVQRLHQQEARGLEDWRALRAELERVQAERDELAAKLQAIATHPRGLAAESQEAFAVAQEFRDMAKDFKPEWSMLGATQDSLREHMRLLKATQSEAKRWHGAFTKETLARSEDIRRLTERAERAEADLARVQVDRDALNDHVTECQLLLDKHGIECGGDGSVVAGIERLLERADDLGSQLDLVLRQNAEQAQMVRDARADLARVQAEAAAYRSVLEQIQNGDCEDSFGGETCGQCRECIIVRALLAHPNRRDFIHREEAVRLAVEAVRDWWEDSRSLSSEEDEARLVTYVRTALARES